MGHYIVEAVKKTRLTSPRTVAIVGFAESSRYLAPYDRRDVEIWGCNEAYKFDFMVNSDGDFRADRWFQIHKREDFTRANNPNDPDHYEWLQAEHNFPIYMQEKFEDVPSSKKYPLKKYDKLFFENMLTADPETLEMRPWLDVYEHGYFTSTFSYMIAMALAEGFEQIEIWGFHMGTQSEYLYQKGACEFWIGQALGREINVAIAGNSPILKGELYGYEFSQIVQLPEIEERLMELHDVILAPQTLSIELQGARKENRWQTRHAEDDGNDELAAEFRRRHLELMDKELEIGAKINFLLGATGANYAMKEQISERHTDETGEGWVGRLSLEVHLNSTDDRAVEARSSLDATTGARMELDLLLLRIDDPELRERRSALFQAEIDWDNKLNFILGEKTEVKRYMLQTDNRTPNLAEDKGFGDMLLLDLQNPMIDVLELGKDKGD